MDDQEYIKQLEKTIAPVINGLHNIPLKLFIKTISGFEILSFKSWRKRKKYINEFIDIGELTKKTANEDEIISKRKNEVGNKVEPIVKKSLLENKYSADTPKSIEKREKSSGYPDLGFYGKKNFFYLECKTYGFKSIRFF